MFIKTLFIIAFLLIIISLGSALFHLVNHQGEQESQKTLKALTIRIGLSVALFIMLFVAVATGLVTPHGIGTKSLFKIY